MHMVGHQHIGVHLEAVGFPRRDQPVAVLRVIVRRKEDGLSVVAPLDDVQRLAFDEIASEAGHGRLNSTSFRPPT